MAEFERTAAGVAGLSATAPQTWARTASRRLRCRHAHGNCPHNVQPKRTQRRFAGWQASTRNRLSGVDPKTGEQTTMKSKKWWGRYRASNGKERRVPLAADKSAAQAMLNDLVRKAEREAAGLIDPTDDHAKRPLKQHIRRLPPVPDGQRQHQQPHQVDDQLHRKGRGRVQVPVDPRSVAFARHVPGWPTSVARDGDSEPAMPIWLRSRGSAAGWSAMAVLRRTGWPMLRRSTTRSMCGTNVER